jgi:hypothetical protein
MTDVAKIAAALERPGIDPRKFVELAVITAVAVDGQGVHADVITADGLHETVALAPPYGGAGYGFYGPLQLDDAVLIAMPDGKHNAGGRIIGRIWDPGSPPPAEVSAHPEDVAIVVRPGQTIRIRVSGGGNAVIDASDGGHVLLGDDGADDPALGSSDGQDFMLALAAAIGSSSGNPPGAAALSALANALQSLPPGPHAGKKWPVGADLVRIK